MRRLNCAHSQLGRAEIVARLESRGIPVYVDSLSAFRNPGRGAIFVCLDAQYADAVALLRDENHIVAEPVDVEAFWKKVPGTVAGHFECVARRPRAGRGALAFACGRSMAVALIHRRLTDVAPLFQMRFRANARIISIAPTFSRRRRSPSCMRP
jgi:hypothetical protein